MLSEFLQQLEIVTFVIIWIQLFELQLFMVIFQFGVIDLCVYKILLCVNKILLLFYWIDFKLLWNWFTQVFKKPVFHYHCIPFHPLHPLHPINKFTIFHCRQVPRTNNTIMFAARLCTRVSVARPLIQPLASVQPVFAVRTFQTTPKVLDESLEQAAKFIGAGLCF